MSKPYKFFPNLATTGDIPPEYQWVVQIRYGSGFSPVHTMPFVYCTDYATAFECLDAWLPNSKKRVVYVKQRGIKHKHYYYDERFAAALEIQADIDAGEFFEDETEEDRAGVQLHHKRGIVVAKWRGIRREEGKRTEEEFPF